MASTTTDTGSPPDRTARFGELILALGEDEHAVLTGLTWSEYQRLVRGRENQGRAFAITYDRGRVEVMTLSFRHERWKTFLAALLECYATEMGLLILPAGSLTISRKDLDRGFEPDASYYLANSNRVAERDQIDFDIDPPPDLVIEIEWSRNIIDRLPVCESLGIPEIWRYDGTNLTVLALQPDRTYHSVETSPSFPKLPLADIARFLHLGLTANFTAMIREFRTWIQQYSGRPENREKDLP